MNYRKYLKISLKQIENGFQLVVEKSNGKIVILKSFETAKAAENYRKQFVNG